MVLLKVLVFTSLFVPSSILGQSIYKTWYSEADTLCMQFVESGYSQIDELEYVKINLSGKKLKIVDYYEPNSFFGGKGVYLFNVEKLTEDTLILTQDFEKNQFEHISGERIVLRVKPNGCDGTNTIKDEK